MLDITKLNPVGGQSKRGVAPAKWIYGNNAGDDVTALGYFNKEYSKLSVGDIIEVMNYAPDGITPIGTTKYFVTASSSIGVFIEQYLSVVTATQAEINTGGKIIVPFVLGKQIKPVSLEISVIGTFETGTSVEITDDNGTPINVASIAQAGLVDGAIIKSTDSNVTLGAGFGAPVTLDKNIVVGKLGSDFTGGTSLTFKIGYKLV